MRGSPSAAAAGWRGPGSAGSHEVGLATAVGESSGGLAGTAELLVVKLTVSGRDGFAAGWAPSEVASPPLYDAAGEWVRHSEAGQTGAGSGPNYPTIRLDVPTVLFTSSERRPTAVTSRKW